MSDYPHKVKPYEHQAYTFEKTRDEPSHGLFLEQRLGKSKVTVDTAAWLYGRGEIDAVLVSAPNGVHRAWVYGDAEAGDPPEGHFGEHLPDHVEHRGAYWSSQARKAERDQLAALYDPKFQGLRVLAVNIEAMQWANKRRRELARGAAELKRFLETFRVLWVIDESTCIKNTETSTRAEMVAELAPLAPYRRLLSGEPAPEGPTDLWGQLLFLEDHPLGFTSYYSFRARYCTLQKRLMPHPTKPGKKIRFQSVVGYKNEAELAEKLERISVTFKRRDCGDMPEQIKTNRYVELSKEQIAAYELLAKEWRYELKGIDDESEEVDVERALTRIIRFNQICGGFLPDEEGNPVAFKQQPKMDALLAELEALAGRKVIIWAHFKPELKMITETLRKLYGERQVVRFYGDASEAERDEAKARFQHDPTCRFFVGNPQVGRYNLTLSSANDVIWYSWDHPLESYIQANDRPVLPGKKEAIAYQHLVVPGTFEATMLNSLKRKIKVTEAIRKPTQLQKILNRRP